MNNIIAETMPLISLQKQCMNEITDVSKKIGSDILQKTGDIELAIQTAKKQHPAIVSKYQKETDKLLSPARIEDFTILGIRKETDILNLNFKKQKKLSISR